MIILNVISNVEKAWFDFLCISRLIKFSFCLLETKKQKTK